MYTYFRLSKTLPSHLAILVREDSRGKISYGLVSGDEKALRLHSPKALSEGVTVWHSTLDALLVANGL